MRKLVIVALVLGVAAAVAACGKKDEHTEPVTIAVTITPAQPTVGVPVEFEVEALEGTEHVVPEEVHVEISPVSDPLDVVERQATRNVDHYRVEYTFDTSGTYDIHVEAHMGGHHAGDVVTDEFQLTVQ